MPNDETTETEETTEGLAEQLEEFEQDVASTLGQEISEPAEDDPEPTSNEPADAPADEPEAPADPEPEAAPEPEQELVEQAEPESSPTEPRYTFQGETKTLKQWEKEGKLDLIFTNAEQSPHFQDKYRKLKEAEEARQAAQQQPEQPPAQATPEQRQAEAKAIHDAYKPYVDNLVKEGVLDEDFVEDNPKVATRMMHMYDMGLKLQTKVKAIERIFQGAVAQARESAALTKVRGHMTAVADSGEAFAGLKDEEHRGQFEDWLKREDSPFYYVPFDRLDDDLMRTMYGQFLARTGAAPTLPPQPVASAAATQERRLAGSGASQGGRTVAGRRPKAPDEFGEFEDELRGEQLI